MKFVIMVQSGKLHLLNIVKYEKYKNINVSNLMIKSDYRSQKDKV
jgi:hypothetical protein